VLVVINWAVAVQLRYAHNTSSMKRNGFTLIELLVVIAIIGVLASVVLGSLNSARTKAKDAAVLSDMDAVAPEAVLYEDANRTFGTSVNDCTAAVFSDPKIASVFINIAVQNGGATNTCYAADTTYSVAVNRPTGDGFVPPTVYWCMDSSGKKCGINDVAPLASTGLCGCP